LTELFFTSPKLSGLSSSAHEEMCSADALCQRPPYHVVPLEVNELVPTDKACPLGEGAYDPEETAKLITNRQNKLD